MIHVSKALEKCGSGKKFIPCQDRSTRNWSGGGDSRSRKSAGRHQTVAPFLRLHLRTRNSAFRIYLSYIS